MSNHLSEVFTNWNERHYEDIRVDVREDILVIYLSRPDRHNAMRLEMRRELIDCFLCVEADTNLKGIVITGAGDRAFSAGADLHELAERTTESELARGAEMRRELPRIVETLSKPTVAAINGICVGAGLELSLACTFRIASVAAEFGLPEVNMGVTPGSGGSQRLPRVVGLGWAMHLIASGDRIDAEKAVGIGLVTEVVNADMLLDRAVDLARLVGNKPRMAFVASRDALLSSYDMGLAAGLDLERKLFAICAATADKNEAVAAFLEKRDPHFLNR